jgi:acetyl-CoA synthetase
VVFARARDGLTRDDEQTLRAELDAAVSAALGRALRPRALLLVDALPRTRSGKILRRLVRAAYLGEPPGDVSALEDPAALDAVRRAR